MEKTQKRPVGRPSLFTERRAITVYIEASVAEALTEAAGDDFNQSLSRLIATILTNWVKRRHGQTTKQQQRRPD